MADNGSAVPDEPTTSGPSTPDAPIDVWAFVRSTRWRTHFTTDPDDPSHVLLADYVADEPSEGDRVYDNLTARDELLHELHLIPNRADDGVLGGVLGAMRKGINAVWQAVGADRLHAAGPDKAVGTLLGTHRMLRLDYKEDTGAKGDTDASDTRKAG